MAATSTQTIGQGPVAVAVPTPLVKQLSDGNSQGTVLGVSSGDLIGFYNSTPVPQILQGTLAGLNGLLKLYATTQTPIAVGANTTTESNMVLTGVGTTDMVVAIIKPTSQAGVAVGTARVSGANAIGASFGNLTGSAITPTVAEQYYIATASSQLQYPAVTLTPAPVALDTVVEQQFTVTGVQPGMVVYVNKPTLQAGLLVTGARVVAPNIVGITFLNVTGSTITPTAGESYTFFAAQGLRIQPVMQNMQAVLTPVAVASNTTAEQTFTITGLLVNTAVIVDKPSATTGISLVGARVSAANTLALNYANVTSNSITPPVETYTIGFFPQPAPAAGSINTQQAAHGIEAGRALSYQGLLSPDAVPDVP